MEYIFLANLQQEFALPEKGILSRVLQKDDFVNVTLFGFSAGEELSGHSAPTPAVLYFLEGEAEVKLGEDTVEAQAGSFVYMPPMLHHGISAKVEEVLPGLLQKFSPEKTSVILDQMKTSPART